MPKTPRHKTSEETKHKMAHDLYAYSIRNWAAKEIFPMRQPNKAYHNRVLNHSHLKEMWKGREDEIIKRLTDQPKVDSNAPRKLNRKARRAQVKDRKTKQNVPKKTAVTQHVNAQNVHGASLLHYVVYNGSPEHVDQLLALGADPLLENLQFETPLSLAFTLKRDEIACKLIRALRPKPKTAVPILKRNVHGKPYPLTRSILRYAKRFGCLDSLMLILRLYGGSIQADEWSKCAAKAFSLCFDSYISDTCWSLIRSPIPEAKLEEIVGLITSHNFGSASHHYPKKVRRSLLLRCFNVLTTTRLKFNPYDACDSIYHSFDSFGSESSASLPNFIYVHPEGAGENAFLARMMSKLIENGALDSSFSGNSLGHSPAKDSELILLKSKCHSIPYALCLAGLLLVYRKKYGSRSAFFDLGCFELLADGAKRVTSFDMMHPVSALHAENVNHLASEERNHLDQMLNMLWIVHSLKKNKVYPSLIRNILDSGVPPPSRSSVNHGTVLSYDCIFPHLVLERPNIYSVRFFINETMRSEILRFMMMEDFNVEKVDCSEMSQSSCIFDHMGCHNTDLHVSEDTALECIGKRLINQMWGFPRSFGFYTYGSHKEILIVLKRIGFVKRIRREMTLFDILYHNLTKMEMKRWLKNHILGV